MSNNIESGSRSSRTGYRAKRKKTNVILNSLIVIVLLLIVFVAYMIFSSGTNNAAATKTASSQANKQAQSAKSAKSGHSSKKNSNSTDSSTDSGSNTANDSNAGAADNGQNTDSSSSNGTADQSQAVVTQGGASSDVSKTIENPSWKPVGTSQTGQHTTVYQTSSVDWQEMLSAISYAAGIDQSNMTVWFLGRDNANANGAIGTVQDKTSKQKYRVYIQWVDGQGWEPTKVEELTH